MYCASSEMVNGIAVHHTVHRYTVIWLDINVLRFGLLRQMEESFNLVWPGAGQRL